MPGGIVRAPATPSYFGQNITLAIGNGTIPESRLDDMVLRMLTPYFYLGQDNYPQIDPTSASYNVYGPIWPESDWNFTFNIGGSSDRDVRANHTTLIRELGAAGTVLLKNTNGALPLKAPKSIGVFGNDAGDLTNGPISVVTGNYEYGTLPVGGGSGTGRFSSLVTPLEAIKKRATQDGTTVQYILNNELLAAGTNIFGAYGINPIPDVCLIFLKTWAAEGVDRTTLLPDWNGTAVVESVASKCNNTVVITHSGGLNLLEFATHPNVTAILAAHYPGQESGNSIVDVLYGDVNPSGKLPYTIAHNGSDYNAPLTTSPQPGTNDWQSDFTEGLLIDYRHFDAHNITPMYEFGFGLSYTTFDISNIAVHGVDNNSAITSLPPSVASLPGGNPTLWKPLYNVTCQVTNTGGISGATVAQLYISLPMEGKSGAPAGTPVKVLRGFEKAYIGAGETAEVTFEVLRRDISFWDVLVQQWRIPEGQITLSVGLSSRDIKGTATVNNVF
jgi:beta-glucosidase